MDGASPGCLPPGRLEAARDTLPPPPAPLQTPPGSTLAYHMCACIQSCQASTRRYDDTHTKQEERGEERRIRGEATRGPLASSPSDSQMLQTSREHHFVVAAVTRIRGTHRRAPLGVCVCVSVRVCVIRLYAWHACAFHERGTRARGKSKSGVARPAPSEEERKRKEKSRRDFCPSAREFHVQTTSRKQAEKGVERE